MPTESSKFSKIQQIFMATKCDAPVFIFFAKNVKIKFIAAKDVPKFILVLELEFEKSAANFDFSVMVR